MNHLKRQVQTLETQEAVFQWLGEKLKTKKSVYSLPVKIIELFNDMIDQLGSTGWWVFDGSSEQFEDRFSDAFDEDRWVPCSMQVMDFVWDVAFQICDKPSPNELRTHCFRAATALLRHVPEGTDVFSCEEEANSFRLLTGECFAHRNRVRFNLVIGARE
ncbi:hypothetical protein CN311_16110 [Mesorhizobium sanjuanii]|uniref:Uncharacterized protein n=1 Tax=Mesorhizobium sanjuanii TaxID=2037900 RepID=A0A2A6FDS7_9HYPH|nr:hypothetical protein [Mesorhizobium sanjuanii]PDQ20089.1 hypothetical protein CN311_16110 [Mesorhizobium sanjuanii]